MSNKIGGMADGARYRDNLIKRYGKGILTEIERLKQSTVKADDFYFIKRILILWDMFIDLKNEAPNHDFPPYLK